MWVLDFFNDPQIQFFENFKFIKEPPMLVFWKIPELKNGQLLLFQKLNGKYHEITSKEPQFSGAVLCLFLTFFKEWWLYVRPNSLIFQDQWLWTQRTTLITSRIWCQFWYPHNTCLEWHQPWTENKVHCHYHPFPSWGIPLVWFNPFGHNFCLMAARNELPEHCKIQNEWRASETIIIKFEAEAGT